MSQKKGFILPVVVAVVALGSVLGIWYATNQDNSGLNEIEKESIALDIAEQIGVSTNKITLIEDNLKYVRFENSTNKKSIFAKRSAGRWKIIEEKEGYNSCEQLKANGFPSSFMYDCKTKYLEIEAKSLLEDANDSAIVVGIITETDTCKNCVELVSDNKDVIEFILDEDFDNGDYVAVNIPDDTIVSINGGPVETGNSGDDSDDEAGDEEGLEGENTGNEEDLEEENAGDDEDSGDDSGASIVEEIVDSGDVEESEEDSNNNSNSGNEHDDDNIDTEDNNTGDDEGEGQGGEGENTEDQSEGESGEGTTEDDEDNNDTIFDERETIFEDDQEILNFFDIDKSDEDLHVIGDPSEDRSEQ